MVDHVTLPGIIMAKVDGSFLRSELRRPNRWIQFHVSPSLRVQDHPEDVL